ncbi:MAG: WXG100 family type VII secretion target [Anaerolineales bacterium]|nr:WXG100 family type VII secretion target [Anaerolineales bacterium]
MDEIRADYERLEQIANQFANQCQAIQQMLQGVQGAMDPLENGGWIGRGSDAFFAEMGSEVLPASVRLRDALDEASAATKKISEVIRKAEEAAASPFRAR